jgi:tripartite-type tricarboxylate transporter receptor subunit TctC
MFPTLSHKVLLAFSLFCSISSGFASAQSWPERPVRVLVGFAAGGNIDILARMTAQRLSEVLGQQFVVENRVGGNGALAAEAVARAAPDGYTLLWAGTGSISIFPALTKTSFDPSKDFAPVSVIGTSPQVLIVNEKVPARNVQEFIAYVKAQPDKPSYAGGGGPGSVSNLLMALFLKRAGVEMTNVSYRGTAPAMTDVIAGHIPTMFIPLSEAMPQARAGKVRMLAVSSGTRSRQAPEVPTVAESGFPGYAAASWTGLLAPVGTPKRIIDRMAAEFARAVKDTKFVEQLDTHGVEPLGLTPEEFAKFLAADIALWAEAVKVAGVSLQPR